MVEAQLGGVQERAAESQRGTPGAVGDVADEGMSDRRQVDTDLVGASRLQSTRQQGHVSRRLQLLDDLVLGACWAPIGDHRHPRRVARIATDRGIDHSMGSGGMPPHQGDVTPTGRVRGELGDQGLAGGSRAGDDEESRAPGVESVDDAWAAPLADLGDVREIAPTSR